MIGCHPFANSLSFSLPLFEKKSKKYRYGADRKGHWVSSYCEMCLLNPNTELMGDIPLRLVCQFHGNWL
jgi:hypothetical protein